jgi:hypothetical protein
MDAANGIKIFSIITAVMLVILTTIVMVTIYKEYDIIDEEDGLRAIKKLIIATFVFTVIAIATPSQTSVCEMMLSHYIPAEELLEQDTSKFFVNMDKYVEDIINR